MHWHLKRVLQIFIIVEEDKNILYGGNSNEESAFDSSLPYRSIFRGCAYHGLDLGGWPYETA